MFCHPARPPGRRFFDVNPFAGLDAQVVQQVALERDLILAVTVRDATTRRARGKHSMPMGVVSDCAERLWRGEPPRLHRRAHSSVIGG